MTSAVRKRTGLSLRSGDSANAADAKEDLDGGYRWRDILLPPSVISLLRLPLAVCFPLAADRPGLALVVLAVSGFTDVLDGWIARRFSMSTATGAAIDPVTDKLFVLAVAVTLIASGSISPLQAVFLGVRELGELPLVIWLAMSRSARLARAHEPTANALGKLATTLQFAAVAWALFRWPGFVVWLGATAAAGLAAAVSYWQRELFIRRLP